MLHILISTIGIIITIFFVVGTHEAAHFIVARMVGVKVLRFSIGFGKTLWRKIDKSGTEYVIALIPLGGYVKMLDESEGTVEKNELPLAYNNQPYYKKFLIVLAGPVTNIICALLLYWIIFMVGFTTVKPVIGSITPDSIAAHGGLAADQEVVSVDGKTTNGWSGFLLRLIAHAGDRDTIKIGTVSSTNKEVKIHTLDLTNWHLDGLAPDPLASIGVTPYMPPVPLVIGKIADKSPAVTAKLALGDEFIAINQIPIKDWELFITTILGHPDETMVFTIKRQGKIIKMNVEIGHQRNIFMQKSGFLGVGPDFKWPDNMLRKVQYGPIAAFPHAAQQLSDFTYFNFLLIGKLLVGKLSLQSLGGPITIFDTAGTALNVGFLSFIGFLAFLSISIGVINLLPIPGLDGGHLFIQTVEFIIRRPVPEQVMGILYRLGFMLLFFVLAVSLVNDLLRMY